MMRLRLPHPDHLLLANAALTLLAGLAMLGLGEPRWADGLWLLGIVPSWIALLVAVVRAALRRQPGVDMLALAAISFAVLSGALLVAAVVGLMLASGRALEAYAQARAQREMTQLLRGAPKRANRLERGAWQGIEAAAVLAGDRLLVRHGELVAVDGILAGVAELNEATLSGEAAARRREAGEAVCSGVLNVGPAFEMVAAASADASTYAGIVRMVQNARAERSPSQRLADRYALGFTGVSAALALLSWWWSGDPQRCLAVLVVATPCPLILAVPVAIVSGISRCAKQGVMVKGGAALERLALARTLFFDKTGTLTSGYAELVDVACAPGWSADAVLELAASLAQASNHVTSEALVKAARMRAATLQQPTRVIEAPGAGVSGQVGVHQVAIGSLSHVLGRAQAPDWSAEFIRRIGYVGASAVFVGVDGTLIGGLQLLDRIRLEAPRALRQLRAQGIARQVMLTGDRADVAASVGAILGVSEVRAELTPAGKLDAIRARQPGEVAIMVGDGVNDAPALAAADIGVAMGARGAAASSEAADVVLLVDRLDRLADAVRIARRARRIALESVALGIGLSVLAMLAAALGALPPLAGAVLQEGIDLVAIANALRALQRGRGERGAAMESAEAQRLQAEHASLQPLMQQIRDVADALPGMPGARAHDALAGLNQALTQVLLPHERSDDTRLYPDMARLLGGDDPMAAMSGMHREIFRIIDVVNRMVEGLPDSGPDTATIQELQRLLYGLDAMLRLHCAQEDELFHALSR